MYIYFSLRVNNMCVQWPGFHCRQCSCYNCIQRWYHEYESIPMESFIYKVLWYPGWVICIWRSVRLSFYHLALYNLVSRLFFLKSKLFQMMNVAWWHDRLWSCHHPRGIGGRLYIYLYTLSPFITSFTSIDYLWTTLF